MRRWPISASLCCAVACACVCATSAPADVFGPASLVSSRQVQLASGTIIEQATVAEESVISANGRYVAFVGMFGGTKGIWRRDLETGAVEQVAPGDSKLPSISANGTYVSFTTTAQLAPEDDHNQAPDVYVRDMETPCVTSAEGSAESCLPCAEHQEAAERQACPFTLVSAVNGSSEGATYSYPNTEADEEARFGALASPRTAISADGSLVVFETAAESNLLGVPTPRWEILVRDLETDQTRLVSSEYDPETAADTGVPVPVIEHIGAAYPVLSFANARFGGASISADGSTVAWEGQDIARQARLLPAEQSDYNAEINEPLWRRIDEGSAAPTRRVTGGSQPENPLCQASGEQALPENPTLLDPCQGPFTSRFSLPESYLLGTTGANFVPQLSAHGEKVAFLASAREVAAGEEFADTEKADDVYVSEMSPALTRVQALQRLTEIAAEVSDAERAAPIMDLAISPDGSQVAFTTVRTQFPLGSLNYVSTIAARAGIKELFDADLSNATITRVTHGYAGEGVPSEGVGGIGEAEGASSPSFSESGDTLSFSSSADNLVFGDGSDESNAFVVNRAVFPSTPPQQYISSPPQGPAIIPAWQLSVTAIPQPDGAVVLDVVVPAAGRLDAQARGSVPLHTSAHSSKSRSRAHRAGGSHAVLATRTVSTAAASVAAGEALQKMTLMPARAYLAIAESADGLYATITVEFSAPDHAELSARVHVVFKRRKAAHAARRSHASARSKGHRR